MRVFFLSFFFNLFYPLTFLFAKRKIEKFLASLDQSLIHLLVFFFINQLNERILFKIIFKIRFLNIIIKYFF